MKSESIESTNLGMKRSIPSPVFPLSKWMKEEEEEEKEGNEFSNTQDQEGLELDKLVKEEIKNAEQAIKKHEGSKNAFAVMLYMKLIEEFNRASNDVDKIYKREKEQAQILEFINTNRENK